MNYLNKIKTSILILGFLLNIGTFTSYAQTIKGGVLGGLSASQIDGDTQKGYDKLGFFSGVFVEKMFTKVVGAKVELYYIGKGAKNNAGGVEIFKTHLNYVEMPFLLTLNPIEHVEVDFGFAYSYLISAKMFEYGDEVPNSAIDMHNSDFSGIVSGSYYFSTNVAFNIRFDYSLIPVKNNPNWYNSNLSFGFIYKFN
ncbi:MAG: hypothetical protein DRI95_06870 [Bacteroidetes bacterium]|nr:MAG: hypothetical protein DRI95_06870 [Bacteroidota bacterium]